MFRLSNCEKANLYARTRRFPAPWSAEVTPNCFIVRDADGQQLAYVYYESERALKTETINARRNPAVIG
jgi:hypothetical protein